MMNEIHISFETKNNISKTVGFDYKSIVELDPLEESKLTGKKIFFSKRGICEKLDEVPLSLLVIRFVQ